MLKPNQAHWTAIKRLLRYLKNTLFHAIQLIETTTSTLHAYLDMDKTGSLVDRSSISAYITFLGSNTISCCSKKQQVIACSSIKA